MHTIRVRGGKSETNRELLGLVGQVESQLLQFRGLRLVQDKNAGRLVKGSCDVVRTDHLGDDPVDRVDRHGERGSQVIEREGRVIRCAREQVRPKPFFLNFPVRAREVGMVTAQ